MKLILLENVKGTGKKDQIVDVKDGFAMNFLIPNKKAVVANEENLKAVNIKNKKIEEKKKENKENSKKIAEKLKNITVNIKVKSGEDGKLFGTVTSKDIEEALLKQENILIDKKRITLKEKIKLEGTYFAEAKLEEGVEAKLKINVKGE